MVLIKVINYVPDDCNFHPPCWPLLQGGPDCLESHYLFELGVSFSLISPSLITQREAYETIADSIPLQCLSSVVQLNKTTLAELWFIVTESFSILFLSSTLLLLEFPRGLSKHTCYSAFRQSFTLKYSTSFTCTYHFSWALHYHLAVKMASNIFHHMNINPWLLNIGILIRISIPCHKSISSDQLHPSS